MGYPVIRETHIVRLADGRYLMLQLAGCNNDDSGRRRDEFNGRIMSSDKMEEMISAYENEPECGSFDLRIGTRYVSHAKYGQYLRKAFRRALSWNEFAKQRTCYARIAEGVSISRMDGKDISPLEVSMDDFRRDYERRVMYGNGAYRIITRTESDITGIISTLESKKDDTLLYVSRKAA